MRLAPYISSIVICSACLCDLLSASDRAIEVERNRLERIFQEQCAATSNDAHTRQWLKTLIRSPGRTMVYLPRASMDTPLDSPLKQLGRKYAAALINLGEQALEDDADATYIYQLFHQAAAFDQGCRARSILGQPKNNAVKATLAKTNHPRLPWKRKQYWRITSEHYQIVTNQSAEDGVEIARQLEDLYTVWQQLFFEFWTSPSELRTAWKRSRVLKPPSSFRHRVVLFANREQYVRFLRARQPRIEISLGFYDVDSETSFFFGGPESSSSTQIHEATHQLFQETKTGTGRLLMKQNFWAVEGIAMYFESLRLHQHTALLGGLDAHRLQFARYRCLQEQSYLPLAEVVAIGRDALQLDPRIRRIYSQSAGLTHFLMDGQRGKYRRGFIGYLRSVYDGRDRLDSLAEATGTPLSRLDQEYREFLDVDDEDLVLARIEPDALRSLCLGATSVSDAGLKTIPSQSGLEWLDLAGTRTSDAGLALIAKATGLEQLNLAGTRITNRLLERLGTYTRLEELDLSSTAISDEGLKHLANLPRLRVLWLDGTNISDASVESLCGLESLEQLGISQTMMSQRGRQLLRGKFPRLIIE